MRRFVGYLLAVAALVLSCTGRDGEKQYRHLEVVCDSLSRAGATVELRQSAENLLQVVKPESHGYISGWNYVVQSWMNDPAGDEQALKLVQEAEQWEWVKKFPLEYAQLCLNKGLVLKKLRRYDQALEVFKSVLNLPLEAGQVQGEPGKTRFYAMRQLMTLYNFISKSEGYQYFTSLEEEKNPAVFPEYRKEIMIIRAQLAFADDRDSLALEILKIADGLPESDEPGRVIFYNRLGGNIHRFHDLDKTCAIALFKRAVELMSEHGDMDKMGMQCVAVLASVYRAEGRYNEGIDLCYTVLNAGKNQVDTHTLSLVSSELAYLYGTLGDYNKALEWNMQAIEYSRKLDDPVFCGDLYRARSNWLNEQKLTKEALEYLRLADSCYILGGKKQALLFSRMTGGLYRLDIPDSLLRGVTMLKDVTRNPEFKNFRPRHQYSTIFELGRGLAKLGQHREGLALMQKSASWYDEQKDIEMQNYVYAFLTDFYAQNGYSRELAACFPVYMAARDSLLEKEKLQGMADANVKFETTKRIQENKILETEIALQKRTIQSYLFFGAAFVLLVAGFIVWLLMRQRALKLQRTIDKMNLKVQEEKLHDLLRSHKELNRNNEELRAEMGQILSSVKTKEAMEPALDAMLGNLNPRLFTNEDEAKFRQSFMCLYPEFIPALKKNCPPVSKNDELLCMLIFLDFSTDDIALVLGISRESVNKSRYRIRKKLDMSREEGLDEWVKALCKKEV